MSLSAYTAAGVALLCTAAIAGCGSGAKLLGTHTAEVTINGKNSGREYRITCEQLPSWYWTITTLEEEPGFTAMVRTGGETASAESVQIRNLGGFTGSYFPNGVGDAEARLAGKIFTITGSAVGFTAQEPDKTTTAHFSIRTDC